MAQKNNTLLTPVEFTLSLIGCIISVSVLVIPAPLADLAHQDSWISIALGVVYPLYVLAVGSIIIKNYPDNTIMDVSKMCLGNFLGNLLNFGFFVYFMFYAAVIIDTCSNLLRIYSVWFMPDKNIILIIVLIAAYAAYKGLKPLARLSVLAFFIICFMVAISFIGLKPGSILNVQPFLQTPLPDIINGTVHTLFAYANLEFILIIHPYAREKATVIKCGLICILFTLVVYTWVAFVNVFFLGPDIIPESLWPFLLVTESVKLPVINNFRFIFMLLWSYVMFKTVANQYFAATAILNNITKIDRKKLVIFLIPLVIWAANLTPTEVARRHYTDLIMPWAVSFNLFYVTLTAVMVLIKRKIQSKQQNSSAA